MWTIVLARFELDRCRHVDIIVFSSLNDNNRDNDRSYLGKQ